MDRDAGIGLLRRAPSRLGCGAASGASRSWLPARKWG